MVEHLNCMRFYVRINCTVDKHCNILCCSYKYFTIPAAEKYVLYMLLGQQNFFFINYCWHWEERFPLGTTPDEGGGGGLHIVYSNCLLCPRATVPRVHILSNLRLTSFSTPDPEGR